MRVALFPGTFDPLHNGHRNLIERGLTLFDRLVVAVAAGHHKNALFSRESRLELVAAATEDLPGVKVVPFDGLLVDVAKAEEATVLLRGIRTAVDLDYERSMVFMNHAMDPDLETVFLLADDAIGPITSSLVREIAKLGGDVAPFVPAPVFDRITVRLREMDGS